MTLLVAPVRPIPPLGTPLWVPRRQWVVLHAPACHSCNVRPHAQPVLARNFHALTRLDENRAKSQLAMKSGKFYTSVNRVAVWGNHSTTQVRVASRGATRGWQVGCHASVHRGLWARAAGMAAEHILVAGRPARTRLRAMGRCKLCGAPMAECAICCAWQVLPAKLDGGGLCQVLTLPVEMCWPCC